MFQNLNSINTFLKWLHIEVSSGLYNNKKLYKGDFTYEHLTVLATIEDILDYTDVS